MKRPPKTLWLTLAVLAVILIPFVLFGERIEAWFETVRAGADGRPLFAGAAIFAALALDIWLPVPSSLASTLAGVLFGFWGGTLISFAAMTVSCLLGWGCGVFFAGRAKALIGAREYAALEGLFARYGMLILVALRTVPVLAEASVLFAGLIRLPFRRALALLLVGNAAVSLVYAAVGSIGGSCDAMLPAFLASCALSGLLLLLPGLLRPGRHG